MTHWIAPSLYVAYYAQVTCMMEVTPLWMCHATNKLSVIRVSRSPSAERVGDWWSILILRDAFQGLSKFDEFEKNLGISANILARRLKHLTAEGLFERQRYNDHPPRFEYVLTDKGRDFYPVAIALFAWGNRNLAPNEIAMRLGDRATGRERNAIIVDADTGEKITPENTVLLAGPAATEETMRVINRVKRISSEKGAE